MDAIVMNTAYNFRRLNSTDMFLLFRIVGKIGINEFSSCFDKDAVKQMVANVTEDGTNNANAVVGMSVMLEIANVVIGNLPKCEAEIYQLLSNTSDLSVQQVKELDFATFAKMVIEFIKKDEFRDFLKVVSESFA